MKTTCYFCGAKIPFDVEICPNCATPTNPFASPEPIPPKTPVGFVGAGRRGEPISYGSIEHFWRCATWRWIREKEIGGRRAGRSEFWSCVFWSVFVCVLLVGAEETFMLDAPPSIRRVFNALVFGVHRYFTVVGATTWIRRARDSGNSGGLLLFFACFLFYPLVAVPLTPGDLEANQYGPNPRFEWIPDQGDDADGFATSNRSTAPNESKRTERERRSTDDRDFP